MNTREIPFLLLDVKMNGCRSIRPYYQFGHSRFGHTTTSAIELKSIRPWNIQYGIWQVLSSKFKFCFIYIINFLILIMKFRNINFFKHFMINDQYKLDIVDRLVNCKTIKCNYVHYFMISSNYLLFDQTISCILWLLSTHEMASYELFLSKLTTSWCKLFLLFETILNSNLSTN